MGFYKTPWLIGFYVSLKLLKSKLVLKSWKNTRRHLTIALNMLMMAKYFVGLKWWHQKAVTGEPLVMTIKKLVLRLLFFSVGWTESLRRAVKDLWIKMTFYPCQRRTLAILLPTGFEKADSCFCFGNVADPTGWFRHMLCSISKLIEHFRTLAFSVRLRNL